MIEDKAEQMSSDEDEERVKLYNPLERNRKRQHFGACLDVSLCLYAGFRLQHLPPD